VRAVKRFQVLKILAREIGDALTVVPLGPTIDEWYYLRKGSPKDLYLKCMGCPTPVAFGLAVALPYRRVVAIDTDGSLLIDLGIMCTLANERPKNLIVVVLDNQCYETIGCAPTHTAYNVDLAAMARGAGIPNAVTARTPEAFEEAITKAMSMDDLSWIVAKFEPGAVAFPEEKRKRTNGFEDMYRFVRHVEDLEGVTVIPREVKSIRGIPGPHRWVDDYSRLVLEPPEE
jgi:thiamine pyrophosphate-dependent acetolactate synthase large subunit-like protein